MHYDATLALVGECRLAAKPLLLFFLWVSGRLHERAAKGVS
jgi:hypothetical protein